MSITPRIVVAVVAMLGAHEGAAPVHAQEQAPPGAKGYTVTGSLTQFYQGVVAGGTRKHSEYNGTAQTTASFDFGKLAGWKYWMAEAKAELRFGGPLLGGTGGISPVNTAAIMPGADGEVFSITALNFTRLIPIDLAAGELFVAAFGRYNLIDLIDEDFFGGGGISRFMNIAQIGPLTVLREVPLITTLVSLAYVRRGEPFLTFALIDPNDHSTDPGVEDMFADGVTFSPGIHFPTKYFNKSGKHSIGGAITTKKYTPFDAIRAIILPGPPADPVEPEAGSWSASYTFRQYVVERGKRDGWGFFTQVSFANASTSPITTFFDVGLGGNGLLASRPNDEFGIAYAYTDLSKELKDNLDLLPLGGRLEAEHQLELFYDVHLTRWLGLSGNLQVLKPVLPAVKTATIPAARLRVVY